LHSRHSLDEKGEHIVTRLSQYGVFCELLLKTCDIWILVLGKPNRGCNAYHGAQPYKYKGCPRFNSLGFRSVKNLPKASFTRKQQQSEVKESIMPTLHQYDYLMAIGTIFAFLDAWNIGANDVANSFATSVSSRSITYVQAMCIATVMEFSGR
jgi:hypothetical protein